MDEHNVHIWFAQKSALKRMGRWWMVAWAPERLERRSQELRRAPKLLNLGIYYNVVLHILICYKLVITLAVVVKVGVGIAGAISSEVFFDCSVHKIAAQEPSLWYQPVSRGGKTVTVDGSLCPHILVDNLDLSWKIALHSEVDLETLDAAFIDMRISWKVECEAISWVINLPQLESVQFYNLMLILHGHQLHRVHKIFHRDNDSFEKLTQFWSGLRICWIASPTKDWSISNLD